MPPQLKRKNEPIDSPINSQKKAKIIQDEENSEQEDDAPPHVPDPIDIEFTEEHISQSGTIEQMELINFMCHAHLKVDFGPKINFVIGHNGSGKSAILTALTVVLGASANTTQRGKSLNALIKEGSSAGNITIKISNRGDGAYKPSVFQDTIIIERRLNREGQHPYKIKNTSGRIVSTKREELVAILDHLGILINNPITLLTQEMAKKFLSDSTPEEKYKLFMQGTQLSQLQHDYDNVRESLETSRAIVSRKKQALPHLQDKATEAKRQYEDLKELDELDKKVDLLNNELVWSQIIEKEKEAEQALREIGFVEKKLEDIKKSVDEQKEKIAQVDDTIEEVKCELEGFRSTENPYEEERDKMAKELKEKEVKGSNLQADLQGINRSIKLTKVAKEKHLNELQQQTAKMESNSRIKRDEISNEITKMESIKEQKNAELRILDVKVTESERKKRELYSQKDKLEQEVNDYRHKMDQAQNSIRSLESQRGNSMKAYGPRMPDVLNDIANERRWKMRRPVGPFGSTLTLKYPQYADTLESVLGKSLNAFVVECFEDKDLLLQIFRKNNMNYIPIMVSKYDLFDYSNGEPDSRHLNIVKALEFNDEWVKRQMIVANKIEQIILMDDRSEADRLMLTKPHNVILCFTSQGHKIGSRTGMKTDSLEEYRGPARFSKDIDSQIRKRQREYKDIEDMDRQIKLKLRDIRSEIEAVNRDYQEYKRQEHRLNRDIAQLDVVIVEKKDTLREDDPVDLSLYEEDIKECDAKVKRYINQFQSIKEQYKITRAEIKALQQNLNIIEAKVTGREKKKDEYRRKIETLEKTKHDFESVLNNITAQQQVYRTRCEVRKTDYSKLRRLITTWIDECKDDYPDRVETDRTPDEIEKDKRRLETMAEEKNKYLGLSQDDLNRQFGIVLKEWNDAKETIEVMEKLSRTLQKMLVKRIERWEAFKVYISLAAKSYFRYYLQKRGDYGTLKFDYKAQKLELRVSTGDQYRKGSRQKNSRSLSGGEKSFSQISLLLSIWQNISTPIICLDEFDVFMDDVNRKQTMGMIMDAANENASQYIFITPLGAADMVPGPYVTIHRLADPER